MADSHDEKLKVYEQLCNSYRAIDDFRAKLLGFLPLATGTGAFLLVSDQKKLDFIQPLFLPIGIFGIAITLGLFFYELYGIKKCTHLIRAGIALEKDLSVDNGQFNKRPLGVAILINEPLAASVIYPAVLAAWTFLAFAFQGVHQDGVTITFQPTAQWWAITVFLIGLAVSGSYTIFLMRDGIRDGFHLWWESRSKGETKRRHRKSG
jgi:hypothetical protein